MANVITVLRLNCQATNRLLHFSLINLQQKVVLKLSMEDAKKRAKAMKCAVGMHGVLSVSHEGDKMTVVGQGIDSVTLTRLLRKKMGCVELEVVTPVEKKKEEKEKEKEEKGKSNIFFFGKNLAYAVKVIEQGSDIQRQVNVIEQGSDIQPQIGPTPWWILSTSSTQVNVIE
ncbi:hypothetical protein M5K25_026844 [Dendrobium thyrsiflorum]|uniref:Uncharacterized protein n=1 Tax=Dendrobium thyrsiflorum TaxID=117978 RepID=A0ABD0TYC4_DENTH